jgi:hypothetical protein
MAGVAIPSTRTLVTVLDPRGQPTAVVEPKPLTKRLDTLEGKTVFLIDVGFGGGWEFLEETAAWFGRHMLSVKTELVRKRFNMFVDEPDLWAMVKDKGHAVIFGVGG